VKHLEKPWRRTAAVAIGFPDEVGRIPPKMGVSEVAEFL
jgi:hypothetical protein